jgi:hypothetical protein
MTTSADTDALTALYTVLKAALAPTLVLDGPALTELSVPVYVVVGHDDDPDSNEAALTDQAPSALSLTTRQESGRINCVIVAASGGEDRAALRATTKTTLSAVGAALAANPTLSGAVQRAEPGTQALLKQEPNENGIYVTRVFTVAYTAAV